MNVLARARFDKSRLDQPSLLCPAGELVPRRELQLAKDAGHVRLDRLHGQVQAGGDLLVEVAARDQLQDLSLARRQRLELLIGAERLAGAERVTGERKAERKLSS